MEMPIGAHPNADKLLKPHVWTVRPDNGFWKSRAINIENNQVTQAYWEAIKRGKSRIEQKLQLEAAFVIDA
jgi:hypothetical protein